MNFTYLSYSIWENLNEILMLFGNLICITVYAMILKKFSHLRLFSILMTAASVCFIIKILLVGLIGFKDELPFSNEAWRSVLFLNLFLITIGSVMFVIGTLMLPKSLRNVQANKGFKG